MNDCYEMDLDTFLDEELGKVKLTKKGQPRLRKPKESRNYFTQDTENAIIEYLSSVDDVERNKIFNSRIDYAFYKLSENIIHTFKFYYTDMDTIEELKYEVISFLIEKLHLFSHSKSINDKLNKIIVKEFLEEYKDESFIEYVNNSRTVTQQQINDFIDKLNVSDECREQLKHLTPPKAYSYFGTIAKRYLITYNDNNYKKLQEKATVEDIDEDNTVIHDSMNEIEDINYNTFTSHYVKYIDKHLYSLFPKKNDAKTADAILELFRKRDTLDIFNKKALYIYIREITDVSTPQITKITKKMKTLYEKLYNEYYENGFIKI